MTAGAKQKSSSGKKYTVMDLPRDQAVLYPSLSRSGLRWKQEVKKAGLRNVMVDFTGCHGFCQQGPIVIVEPEDIFYTHVTMEDVPDIVHSHLREGQIC